MEREREKEREGGLEETETERDRQTERGRENDRHKLPPSERERREEIDNPRKINSKPETRWQVQRRLARQHEKDPGSTPAL